MASFCGLLRCAAITLAGLLISPSIMPGARAGSITVSGLITDPASYSIADLQELPTQSVTVATGAGAGNYTGVSLWTLFGGNAAGASNIITQGGGNNPILRNYVVATGSGGVNSTISAGEINPLFGGTGAPYLVAFEKNGVTLNTPQLIVPLDGVGQRDVFSLESLSVRAIARPPVGPGGVSSQFTLSGPGISPISFDLAALQALPATTEAVQLFAGPNLQNRTYTGTSLWGMLVQAGLTDPDDLNRLLLATGSDGFQVAFTIAELSQLLGAPVPPDPIDLVVYGQAGTPNGLLQSDGFARLAIPGDFRGGRYVSNLVSLEVVEVIPEPGAIGLLLFAMAMMALVARRAWSTPLYDSCTGFEAP